MKDPFDNVYPTLVECFGIVFIGYLCARLSLLSQNQANGIQIYISKVALPAIIFKSMLELDFSQVSWAFWLGILIAKSILFTFVSLFSLLLNKPVLQHAGKAGIFAIFVTQSNDLALGLPLFDALFQAIHPEYLQYIYLLIPVSMALLNPIGLLMLELDKNSKNKDKQIGKCKLILKTIKSVITNPIVFMVVFGLIANQIFTACQFNKRSWFLTPFLKVLAESFGATALFYLGISLVGNMKKYRGFDLIVPFLLVACKSLILPLVARQTVTWLEPNHETIASNNMTTITIPDALPSFAFIYGTLPTAPTVVVFATMYNVEVDTIGTSMVLGTLLSAPIMFVSSKMISIHQSPAEEKGDDAFKQAIFDVGILTTICCIWVLAVFIFAKFFRRPLHQFTMCLIFAQLGSSLSIALAQYLPNKAVLGLFIIGLFASTNWIGLLGYALSTVRCHGEKALIKRRPIIYTFAVIVPVCLGLSLALSEAGSEYLSPNEKTNAFLVYMRKNKYFSTIHAVLMVISVLTTIVCMIKLQRCDKYCRCDRSEGQTPRKACGEEENGEGEMPTICRQCRTLSQRQNDIEEVHTSCNRQKDTLCYNEDCDDIILEAEETTRFKGTGYQPLSYGTTSQMNNVNGEDFDGLTDIEEITLNEYFQGNRHQLSQHIILLLFLCFFSILNIFLCFERAFGDADDRTTGIFVEIEFIAVVCSLGQGFISFAVFGFDKRFFNFLSFERFGFLQPGCVTKKITLPPIAKLDPEIRTLCQKFRTHHLKNCKPELVKDLRFHFRTYKDVFRGDLLIDWLIEFGLATTREDAVHYGNCLLKGRIIQHCVEEHYFCDLPYYYRFCEEEHEEEEDEDSTIIS